MCAIREANSIQKEVELEIDGNPQLKIEGAPKNRKAWESSMYVKTYASA